MKRLIVLLVVLIPVAIYFGWDWSRTQVQIHNPPVEQIAESVVETGEEVLESERSGSWPTVRNKYVAEHPVCEACGTDQNLNVHHIKPFHEHPELELDFGNLITLCREHHFTIGHDPDGPNGPERPNWKSSNPDVRQDCRQFRDSLSLSP